ncbi:RNA (guanine-9-)-methyltransferase domain-containing protein 1-like protein, mitochondrial [Harpegnathos saltator]|uniref:RNA (guanine-9-)-methyltransferase domain-containing protein 1 n=2 Tax=Harpegnathos saltator TaxID=610380 RepID=E2C0C3_HARSA|nr:RNA (guanine-9-)-methyltransferase domain-containing protein 1-like protein, mitochondrial [Harpegnathos saltator]
MRYLNKSIKIHKKLFTQVICDGTAPCSNVHYINVSVWNYTICKRFYCQTVIQNDNILSNSNNQNINEQQKLDEFLSNPDNKKIFQILELEVDVLRHNAEQVPENIKPMHWLELLDISSKSGRKKYLRYLFTNEKSREKKKAKMLQQKTEKQAIKEEEEEEEDTKEIKYGLAYNSMFLRIYRQTMHNYYNSKLIWAMMFEPKIVFDCGYENFMTNIENHNCAKQLTLAFAANRIHDNPMFLYYCNLNEGSLRNYFLRNMPNLLDKDFPAVVTSQSYLDLFPKDQLVYLTPHCKTNLVEYDSDMVYIIGAMVDKSKPQPLSLAKAKKEDIRMARLPIEKYLDWGSGSTKNFTVNQILSIILDLRHTRSWEQAFRHVPVRKLKETREYLLKRKIYLQSKFLEKIKNKEQTDENQALMRSPNATNFTFSVRKKI